MKDSKLSKILRSLTEKQHKDLSLFVSSPYHNSNQNVVLLLEFVLKSAPEFTDEEFLDKKKALSYVFSDDSLKIQAITKLASKLHKLIEQFLVVEHRLADGFLSDYHLLIHYGKHNLETPFSNLYKSMSKKNTANLISVESLHQSFLMEKEYNRFVSTHQDQGVGDVHFDHTIHALDRYYLLNKLIYECQRINRGKVIKDWNPEDPIFLLLNKLEETVYIDDPAIRVWYEAFQLLTSEEVEPHYSKLKNRLSQGVLNISIGQRRSLWSYLENTAVRNIKDRQKMYEELFEFYEIQNERRILLTDQFAVPGIIRNYVAVALALGKSDEADQFVQQVRSRKDRKDFKEILDFSSALIAFNQAQFDQVVEMLNTIKLSNIYFKIEERRLRIKSYYHLGFFEMLPDALNSFRVFLTENKNRINELHLEHNRTFINFLFKILKQEGVFKKEYADIKKQLNETRMVTDKAWLLTIMT